ncbi:MAG: beta-propeller domain-containing protein [bacterium]|nr:beta-propeller domain-containing protein [bacterium]
MAKSNTRKPNTPDPLKHSPGTISLLGLLLVIIFAVFIGAVFYFSNSQDSVSDNESSTLSFQLTRQSELKKFNDYTEAAEYIENIQSAENGQYGVLNSMGLREGDRAVDEAVRDSVPEVSTGEYSQTNVQVVGVDEADIVKTNGEEMYIVDDTRVLVVKARPPESAEIIASIELSSVPQELYLMDERLVVLGSETSIYSRTFSELIRPNSQYSFLNIYDISQPRDPKLLKEFEFEGQYFNSRMIEDRLYFISSQYSYTLTDSPLPQVFEDGELLPSDPDIVGCFCPDMYYVDNPYRASDLTTVTLINVDNPDSSLQSESFLIDSQSQIFVSQNAMYLAYTKYVNEYQLEMEALRELVEPRLDQEGQNKIADIEAARTHVLNATEKLLKISEIINAYISGLAADDASKLESELKVKMQSIFDSIADQLETTVIHKVDLGQNQLEYKASGEVSGHLLNQFSMDEFDGWFRVATTTSATWSRFTANRPSQNNLYVMDDSMKTVGRVENLAEGEMIYSARFMGSRAYLVTFRQVDPLFVIDLSDPYLPAVVGELKVPGFSSYLHPYDEDTLIGFGKQATEDGRILGLKISLFDVSRPESPVEIDTFELGGPGSDSIALNDHKAWLFSRERNLLVIPVTLQYQADLRATEALDDQVTEEIPTPQHGAAVFTVTKEGLEYRGMIEHSDVRYDDLGRYYYGYFYYDTTVKRSLYIDDTLYTVSGAFLKTHSLIDLSSVSSVDLGSSIVEPSELSEYIFETE